MNEQPGTFPFTLFSISVSDGTLHNQIMKFVLCQPPPAPFSLGSELYGDYRARLLSNAWAIIKPSAIISKSLSASHYQLLTFSTFHPDRRVKSVFCVEPSQLLKSRVNICRAAEWRTCVLCWVFACSEFGSVLLCCWKFAWPVTTLRTGGGGEGGKTSEAHAILRTHKINTVINLVF